MLKLAKPQQFHYLKHVSYLIIETILYLVIYTLEICIATTYGVTDHVIIVATVSTALYSQYSLITSNIIQCIAYSILLNTRSLESMRTSIFVCVRSLQII